MISPSLPVCVLSFFLSFEGIYVRALLLSRLKIPSSLAAGKSFLLAMPLTRCPICAKCLLSSVHANKNPNVGTCTESKKGSFLVVKENSCLLSIYQVKTNGWIMISKWKLPFVSNYCVCLSLGCFEHHHPFLLFSFLLPGIAWLHVACWRFHHSLCLHSQHFFLRGTQKKSHIKQDC